MVGNFEQNENLRQQINEYGYEDVPIWNILVDLKKHLLKENEANYIRQLEREFAERIDKALSELYYSRDNRDIRVYNRAYKVALDVLKVVVTEE